MTLAKSALAAAFAVALVATPASGQATIDDVKKSVDQAVQKLDKLTKDLADAKEAMKTDDLRTKATTLDTKLDILDKDVQDIKKDLREIRQRLGERGTTALRPDTDGATARTQGRVRVINSHLIEMNVVLNGRSYRLPPGDERLILVPPGNYSFEVLQIPGDRRSGEIAAGQTRTFTIYPIP
jgi:hypothetical protein